MYSSVTSLFASGSMRQRHVNGRNYLAVPVTMIVEGVLHGSDGAIYYPLEELENSVEDWEDVPLTLEHPVLANGQAASAYDPGVPDEMIIGFVRHPRMNGNKLQAEAWIEEHKLSRVAPDVHAKVMRGDPVEVSTGLFINKDHKSGSHNGRSYSAVARDFSPDHLAILAKVAGACSIRDGCGVNNEFSLEGRTMDQIEKLLERYNAHMERELDQREKRQPQFTDDDLLVPPTINWAEVSGVKPCECEPTSKRSFSKNQGISNEDHPDLLVPPTIDWSDNRY